MYAWNERSAILLTWYIRGRLTSCRMTQDLGSWEILRVAEQLKKAFVTNFLCMTVNQFEYAEFNDASFFPPDWKHNFWINLVQKFKIVSFSWNLVPRLSKLYRIQWWWTRFLFFTGNNSFWAKYSPKNQTCCFKLKLRIYTKLKVQNLMVVVSVFIFDQKHLFDQIWSEKLKS